MTATETDDGRRSITELRRMDREQARATLSVPEFERWEALQERFDAAEETRAEWEAADDLATEITVHADREKLGTEVDVFGNDVLVRVDPESPGLRDRVEATEARFGDDDVGIEELDEEAAADLREKMVGIYEEIVVEWNGHDFTDDGDLTEAARRQVFADAAEKWGIRGLFMGLADIIAAVRDDQETRLEAVDSFRGSTGGGRRRDTENDRL